jgi:hypothetical protein
MTISLGTRTPELWNHLRRLGPEVKRFRNSYS